MCPWRRGATVATCMLHILAQQAKWFFCDSKAKERCGRSQETTGAGVRRLLLPVFVLAGTYPVLRAGAGRRGLWRCLGLNDRLHDGVDGAELGLFWRRQS